MSLEILRTRHGRRRTPDEPIIGAAIGVGMTAEAAERGGADFLLALNAGRYRIMGAASVAVMLPLDAANRFTDSFARREILDRVSIPVFFGACVFDPGLEIERLAAELVETGYRGVANFPTSIHYNGRFRQALEDAGIGFAREAAFLTVAKRAGLMTFGYAKTRREIDLLLGAGVDLICLNFGWNAGGTRGLTQDLSLDEVADTARRTFQHVRNAKADTICVVEGGPIISPDHMYRVCRDARADGYVGGSTLDRVPLELSVMQVTSSFKTVGILRESVSEQGREASRVSRLAGLVGQSAAVRNLLDQVARLAATSLPIVVTGEPGTGKLALARSIHSISRRSGSIVMLDCGDEGGDLDRLLFGAESGPGRARRAGALEALDATVILDRLEMLSAPLQVRLLDLLDRGLYERVGGASGIAPRARLVAIARGDIDAGGLRRDLLLRLHPGRIRIPPLRERPEDLPLHARIFLDKIGSAGRATPFEITPDGYRRLFSHDWPENIRELRAVLEAAALIAQGGRIGEAEIAAQLRAGAAHERPTIPPDEKSWIMDALRRNGFRRGRTAAFLGLSRKTLYNKMKRYDLLS